MKPLRINQIITNRQDNSLKIFFREISRIPRISSEEEIELGNRIKNGDKTAVNKLVEANLRFVVSVAKQYQGKGIPLVDLIQSGCEGCIKAAEMWDPSKGFKFISYAVWWIRQSILYAISDQCRTIRAPMNQIVSMNKINKVYNKLEQELERTPSNNEIEEELGVDDISLTLSSITKSSSLDTPFKSGEANSLLDIIPGSYEETDEEVNNEFIAEVLRKIVDKLPSKESDTIRLIYGIGIPPMSKEAIARKFGVGEERVRQFHKNALKTIRRRYKNLLTELI